MVMGEKTAVLLSVGFNFCRSVAGYGRCSLFEQQCKWGLGVYGSSRILSSLLVLAKSQPHVVDRGHKLFGSFWRYPSLMPFAYERGGNLAGLGTVIGFAVALAL
jgi:hypothetical protein